MSTMDEDLENVFGQLQAIPDLRKRIGDGIRQALDEVIDCARTGRYCVEQLEKTEKTYIGTKVEIVLRQALKLPRGTVLDNLIGGQEVDTKFSLRMGWMIPREAVGQLCFLIWADDNASRFGAGLLRTEEAVLTPGRNQDKKRSISAVGRTRIRWLLENADLPPNFLLKLPDDIRSAILGAPTGTERLHTLFRMVTNRILPRTVLIQVAQLPGDPMKRARDSKAILASEGLAVACATYVGDREIFRRAGFAEFRDDDWISVRTI